MDQCLADYPDFRSELEPLLRTFQKVSTVRRVAPSAEFKQTSYNRLMSRIKTDSRQLDRKLKNKFDFNSLRRSLAFKTLVPGISDCPDSVDRLDHRAALFSLQGFG